MIRLGDGELFRGYCISTTMKSSLNLTFELIFPWKKFLFSIFKHFRFQNHQFSFPLFPLFTVVRSYLHRINHYTLCPGGIENTKNSGLSIFNFWCWGIVNSSRHLCSCCDDLFKVMSRIKALGCCVMFGELFSIRLNFKAFNVFSDLWQFAASITLCFFIFSLVSRAPIKSLRRLSQSLISLL